MAEIKEGKHAGEWMAGAPNQDIWQKVGKVVSGESRVLVTGSIMMGGVNPGEFTEWAKAIDGSADPVGILFTGKVDATVADVPGVIIAVREVQANRAELTWPDAATAAEKLYAETVLAGVPHIVVQDSCTTA